MQSMSDKELDQLFQSRFETFESEPSASLWSSIENRLEPKIHKKPIMPVFWMAAASVVVVLAAGLWFLKPEPKVFLQGQGQMAAAKPEPVEVSPVEEPKMEDIAVAQTPVKPSTFKKQQPVPKAETVAAVTQVNELPGAEAGNQVMMASVEVPEVKETPVTTGRSSVPEDTHPHSRRGEVHQTVLAMLPPDEAVEDQPVQERRRIRSVGDIVNFVVAKVDQREDKLIEISEDDEGTKISGINLGLFKIKSKKR